MEKFVQIFKIISLIWIFDIPTLVNLWKTHDYFLDSTFKNSQDIHPMHQMEYNFQLLWYLDYTNNPYYLSQVYLITDFGRNMNMKDGPMDYLLMFH